MSQSLFNDIPSVITKCGVFDYSACIFEARIQKKGFLGQLQTRFIYCTENSFCVCKEPYQNKPDKIINLKPDWHLQWIIDSKKQNQSFEKKTIGFKLLTDTSYKIEYHCDNIVIIKLREYFSKRIFQLNFFDEFEIIQKIGKGKYAKVYKVKKIDNGKFYAVKYLHKKKLEQIEDAFESIFNELKILRMLNHPNCIKIIATYEDEYGYYILTELYDSNKTLQGELQKFENPQFGYNVVRHIMKQLLKGIEYVHSLGIMHRDLKPQNIMFQNEDNTSLNDLKIIDFGLAQFTKDTHFIYVHVGTPGYVAPEILANQSENHRYSEQCDLFSIGVILHILLTGKSVFPGKKFSQVLELNKQCQIKFEGKLYEQINKDSMDLLYKLLEPNPLLRLSATQALKHQFFQNEQTKQLKVASAANLDSLMSPVDIKVDSKTPLKFGMKNEFNFKSQQKQSKSAVNLDSFNIDLEGLNKKLVVQQVFNKLNRKIKKLCFISYQKNQLMSLFYLRKFKMVITMIITDISVL
ncbi:protein kinase domain protein [Ichthyophthirius multifiliis]|uniref:Protein kinase domain protein n=1 Tax=Ichthyophthirius multifiliis TaxID=5932 RepID=G0R0L5_ICHMU|nr:protein kinase domain protein [Ichthyophthirius multifiliis]EGR29001.1 protein kinase domain protein [Ichthyophthirius multifiliis]|eukprot:XP_004030237.1 protein kinase domain protein [Ichthyophthirius multifiliis]